MAEDHQAYFPKHRDEELFEKNLRRMSEEAETDPHGHGNSTMDQHGTAHHSSFDYKPAHRNAAADTSGGRSHTTKFVPQHQDPVPAVSHSIHHIHNDTQIAPAPDEGSGDIEAQDVNANEPSTKEHHTTSQHHEPSHKQSHKQSMKQSHKQSQKDEDGHHIDFHVAHSDDPDIRAQLAHNHALTVNAPTAMHAADGNWCTGRCIVFSFFMILGLGIIVT
jgi:hypothetical protein